MRAILMFHSIDTSGSVLSVSPDELRSLVRAIAKSGHSIVPLRKLVSESADGGLRSDSDAVALTFDDGMRSLHEAAMPILKEEGAPATLFLTTDFVGDGQTNRWPTQPEGAPTMSMMNWSQVEALHAEGWAIEAHTATHPDLRSLSDDAIREEFERCDAAIESKLGHRPEGFAYPYGYVDDRVSDLASERYRFSVTVEMKTLVGQASDPHRIPRLETFYFRGKAIHSLFGTVPFAAYLKGRSMLRSLRAA